MDLAAGTRQFAYSIVVSYEERLVWTVRSRASKILPGCRYGLTSSSVVARHYRLGHFFKVPSSYKAVVFICCQANIHRGNKSVGVAECL